MTTSTSSTDSRLLSECFISNQYLDKLKRKINQNECHESRKAALTDTLSKVNDVIIPKILEEFPEAVELGSEDFEKKFSSICRDTIKESTIEEDYKSLAPKILAVPFDRKLDRVTTDRRWTHATNAAARLKEVQIVAEAGLLTLVAIDSVANLSNTSCTLM